MTNLIDFNYYLISLLNYLLINIDNINGKKRGRNLEARETASTSHKIPKSRTKDDFKSRAKRDSDSELNNTIDLLNQTYLGLSEEMSDHEMDDCDMKKKSVTFQKNFKIKNLNIHQC